MGSKALCSLPEPRLGSYDDLMLPVDCRHGSVALNHALGSGHPFDYAQDRLGAVVVGNVALAHSTLVTFAFAVTDQEVTDTPGFALQPFNAWVIDDLIVFILDLGVTGHQHLSEQRTDLRSQLADEFGHGGELRSTVAGDGHEQDVLAASALDGSAADHSPAVGQQYDLEHDGRVVGRGTGHIVAVVCMQFRYIELVVDQVVECIFKAADHQPDR